MSRGIGRRALVLVLDATAVAVAPSVTLATLALGDNPVTGRASSTLTDTILGLAPVGEACRRPSVSSRSSPERRCSSAPW